MTFNIRRLQQHDLDEVVELVNVAYRTQSARAWTTEHAFVEGQRISKNQLKMMLQEPNFELFVGEFESNQPIACIGLSNQKNSVEIGTFAIHPNFQNFGYGRTMLDFAEVHILKNHPAVTEILMYVLDIRTELTAYYQRRGYKLTGGTAPYPISADVGKPLVPVQLLEMKKIIRK